MSLSFKQDNVCQLYVNSICEENRTFDLLKICDNYYYISLSAEEQSDWMDNFKEFVGLHHFGEEIWKFIISVPKGIAGYRKYGAIYFIGVKGQIEKKLINIL